ncbi:unnamed protein product [Meloidogyne enterolobii]|uniref:Uncharacterized protein n=1 Tax=Meloidogyne enterolobii TaxID=390850 RepID=A0ACB1ACZ4_MELEN
MESKNQNFDENLYMTNLAYKNWIEDSMQKEEMKKIKNFMQNKGLKFEESLYMSSLAYRNALYRMMQNDVDLALSISSSRDFSNALPQAGHANRDQHPSFQQQQVRNVNTHRELYPALQWQLGTTVNTQREQHPALQQQQESFVNPHQYIQNLGSTQGQENSGIGSKSINQPSVLNKTAHQYGDYLRGQNPQNFSQQTHNQNLNQQNVQHAPNVSINNVQPANQQSNSDDYIRSLGDIICISYYGDYLIQPRGKIPNYDPNL